MKIILNKGFLIYNLQTMEFNGLSESIYQVGSGAEDKLLSQFNTCIPPELAPLLPFNSNYGFKNSYQHDLRGVHYQSSIGESLKIHVPVGSSDLLLYDSGNELYVTIKFDTTEAQHEKIVLLSSIQELPKTVSGSPDANTFYLSHVSESKPHLDTFLSVNLGHTKIQCDKYLGHKSKVNSDIVGNTYVDSSGRLYYLGEYCDVQL